MSDSISTLRVDSTQLSANQDKVVRLVGKALSVSGDQVVLDSNGAVNLILPASALVVENEYYEVTGKVSHDLTVRALDVVSLGSKLSK